jgi:hypothetical protein
LGRLFAADAKSVAKVERAFQQGDREAVANRCRRAASAMLFTKSPSTVEALAVCLFAHVAERLAPHDPAATLAHLFGKTPQKPTPADEA